MKNRYEDKTPNDLVSMINHRARFKDHRASRVDQFKAMSIIDVSELVGEIRREVTDLYEDNALTLTRDQHTKLQRAFFLLELLP